MSDYLRDIKVMLHRDEYLSDKETICAALKRAGYRCSVGQAGLMWDAYSDSMAAGWMGVPDDDEEILACIRPYFDEANEE